MVYKMTETRILFESKAKKKRVALFLQIACMIQRLHSVVAAMRAALYNKTCDLLITLKPLSPRKESERARKLNY